MSAHTERNGLLKTLGWPAVLASLLALGLWATTAEAARKKAEEKPVEVAGVHATPDGFTLIEAARAEPQTREDYSRAIGLLEQQRYADGIAVLVDITAKVPTLTAAHVDLGIAWGKSGDTAKAEASLKRALELNPRHPVAWNELGVIQRRQGKFAEARAAYQKALEAAPEFHFARLNLAIVCDLYLADTACALENYLAYQRAVPGDRQAAIWIADLEARAGSRE
jgi:Tfp pilus assembly protein PilF